MERQQAFDFLREMFPLKSVSVSETLSNYNGKETETTYNVCVHDCCKNPNGGLAVGDGASWNEAIKKMFERMFDYGEA